MTDRTHEFEQRISEHRDGGADAPRDAEVLRLIAEDAEAARLDRTYARLDEMLAAWRRLPEGADFRSFRARVARAVAADAEFRVVEAIDAGVTPAVPGVDAKQAARIERAYAKTDDAIQAAAGALPPVDWSALKGRISAAVRDAAGDRAIRERTIRMPERGRAASGQRWWTRIGGTIAAAAAVVIAANVWFHAEPPVTPGPTPPVTRPRVVVTVDAPASGGRVRVAFDETPGPAAAEGDSTPRGAAIAVGPGMDGWTPTADDALLQ